MGQITVFLDNTGRPIGTCPAGHESNWLNDIEGNNHHAGMVARQVSATDDEWDAWARRNVGYIGLCRPWFS